MATPLRLPAGVVGSARSRASVARIRPAGAPRAMNEPSDIRSTRLPALSRRFTARNASVADGEKCQALARASNGAGVGRTVSDVERDLILDTLDHCLGNRTHAANILGISIRTLRNKLREYSQAGIPIAQPGEARTGT